MGPSSKSEILAYMRLHRFIVVATVGADGGPQSALVNIATTNAQEIIFNTISSSRKHANLLRDPRIAATFSGPDQQTLQVEGVGVPMSSTNSADYQFREAYYAVWPDGRETALLPEVVFWRIAPRWARYSDYLRGPLVAEFTWVDTLPDSKIEDSSY